MRPRSPRTPLTPRTPPPGGWFVVELLADEGDGAFTWREVWDQGAGELEEKVGGRLGTAENPGIDVLGAGLAEGDYALCRSADGAAGLSFELFPLGAGGGASPLTTKGDLYTRTSSADARLPVGTDGHVLTADSGEATGLKWAAPAGGGVLDYDGIVYGGVTVSSNNTWTGATAGTGFVLPADGLYLITLLLRTSVIVSSGAPASFQVRLTNLRTGLPVSVSDVTGRCPANNVWHMPVTFAVSVSALAGDEICAEMQRIVISSEVFTDARILGGQGHWLRVA